MSNKDVTLKEKVNGVLGDTLFPATITPNVYDSAKRQALSQTLANTPDKSVLGFPAFSTVTAYAVDDVVYYGNKLWRFTTAHAAGQWDENDVTEYTVADLVNDLKAGLLSGDIVAQLAENLESWAGESVSAKYEQTAAVDTTGGTVSIDSSVDADLESVVPTTDFFAQQLISTGFNLLRRAVAVGNGWYFEVPHLVATQQSIGTALENNGVLFTSSTHENLRPTVYFKPLSAGVPTSVTDGTLATYTDKDGRRHYTTSGEGYLVVSGIDRASVCAHLGWSRRYDDYISVADEADAGSVVDMAAGIHALHDYDKMLVIGAVADRIVKASSTTIRWTRRLDRVQPSWTNTPVEEEGVATGQYLHEAVISAMKADGAATFETLNTGLSVSGTTVSYTDGNAEAVTDYVKYELAAEATGTAAVSSAFKCEDWGLIVLRGATGTAKVNIAYGQNVPDNLRTALPVINDLNHCTGSIGQGTAVCSTGTYDKDKVVTIQHFMLLQYAQIHVLFTTPINTERSTLNVSLTGAKPLRILGQNLPAGVVKAQTYATLVYDGEAWNIVNMFRPGSEFDPSGLVVDMGLASGLKWAARDLDITKPGGFCDTPFTYEKSFFSWGNIDGYNPKNNSFAGVYNWGGSNAAEPWYDGQPYGNTKGNTLAGDIPVGEEFDAARANLGEPWRMPTSAEFAELFAGSIYIDADGNEVDTSKADKRVTVNGIVGLYLQSKTNGNRLFFSASGNGSGSSWDHRGAGGGHWSCSFSSSRYARYLNFSSGGVDPQGYNKRYYGFAVRAVQN